MKPNALMNCGLTFLRRHWLWGQVWWEEREWGQWATGVRKNYTPQFILYRLHLLNDSSTWDHFFSFSFLNSTYCKWKKIDSFHFVSIRLATLSQPESASQNPVNYKHSCSPKPQLQPTSRQTTSESIMYADAIDHYQRQTSSDKALA